MNTNLEQFIYMYSTIEYNYKYMYMQVCYGHSNVMTATNKNKQTNPKVYMNMAKHEYRFFTAESLA